MEVLKRRVYQSSKSLFEQAQKSIPGGVNSPVRAFGSVGGTPIFMKGAKGAKLFDEDGNDYVDFINSWGPMILGHCHDEVVEAIREQAGEALSFGAPTELETRMAELIKTMVPNVDLVRLVSSGTEACMSALRLARGFTGKEKFIKFEGNYHGHADPFLINSGSGLATFNIESVPGVTKGIAQDTLIAPYNDLEAVESLIIQHPDQIAAVILEPVAGNMGCVPPAEGFLKGMRELCDRHGIVLIFDEVMTGFRLSPGGAQQRYDVWADLITFGKVIGGGLPVGAFGGKEAIMNCVAPLGNVYQAGTLSGNPIALSAGYTTLSLLNRNRKVYDKLETKGKTLKTEISSILNQKGIPHQVNWCGSMISVHFSENPITDFNSAKKADNILFNRFFHHMLSKGVYLPPSAFESWFFSNSLQEDDIGRTIKAVQQFEG
jgi:glutamate-1-semialdehyde 2,1-aminomutase